MKKYIKIINIILLIVLSFFIFIYGIAYIMKDRADNEDSREICRQVYEGPKKIINLISQKFIGKEILENDININGLIKAQEKVEKKITKEYSELEYTWRSPYIKVNPYGNTPLSTLIKFKTDEPMKVRIEIIDREGTNMEYLFNEYITEHEYGISGLYLKGDTELQLILEEKDGKIKKKKIKVKARENTVNKENFIVRINNLEKNNFYYVRGYSNLGIIIDNFGSIRGIKKIGIEGGVHLKNGNYLNGFGKRNIIFEENEIGKILKVYELGKYSYHHHALEMENGNFLLAVNKDDAVKIDQDGKKIETVEDHIIEIDRATGKIVKEWDIGDILDVNRLYQGMGKGGDWFHMNSFIYDKKDNSLIISGNNQGVIKIDYETGKLKWIMAYHKDWGRAGRDGKSKDLNKYLLYATDKDGNRYSDDIQKGNKSIEEFEFPVGQHDLSWVGENQILMFDNRRLTAPVFKNQSKKYSRAVIYEIDEKNMNIKEIWSFGKELKDELYSSVVSSAEQIGNSILIGAGAVENSNSDNGRIIQVNKDTKDIELDIVYTTNSSLAGMNFYQVNKLK